MKKAGQRPLNLNAARPFGGALKAKLADSSKLEAGLRPQPAATGKGGVAKLGLPPEISGDAVAKLMVQDAAHSVQTKGKVDKKAVLKMLHRAVMEDTTAPGQEIKASDVASMVRRAQAQKPGKPPNAAAAKALSHVKAEFGDSLDKDALELIQKLEQAQSFAGRGENIPSSLLKEIKSSDAPLLEKAVLTSFVRKEYASHISPSDLSSLDRVLGGFSTSLLQMQMDASTQQSEMLADEARRSQEASTQSDRAQQELMSIARDHRSGRQHDIRHESFDVGVDRAEVGEARDEFKVGFEEIGEARQEVKVSAHEVGEERYDTRVQKSEVKEIRAERFFDAEDVSEGEFGKGLDDAGAALSENAVAQVKGETSRNSATSPWQAAMLSVRFPGASAI